MKIFDQEFFLELEIVKTDFTICFSNSWKKDFFLGNMLQDLLLFKRRL